MQLVIDLPPREEQIAFNRRRWSEICVDPTLAKLPGKIESNVHGHILMMPPASGGHSYRQYQIQSLLTRFLHGIALPECPVSTLDGVRAADVGWYSESRFVQVKGQIAFELAPEICVEVLFPCNTTAEMSAKKKLYFEAGAEYGSMRFYHHLQPDLPAPQSLSCPDFPLKI